MWMRCEGLWKLSIFDDPGKEQVFSELIYHTYGFFFPKNFISFWLHSPGRPTGIRNDRTSTQCKSSTLHLSPWECWCINNQPTLSKVVHVLHAKSASADIFFYWSANSCLNLSIRDDKQIPWTQISVKVFFESVCLVDAVHSFVVRQKHSRSCKYQT